MSKAKNAKTSIKTPKVNKNFKKNRPTPMQRIAFEALRSQVGNGRINVGKALRKAGYSESIASKRPDKVTKSKGWLMLLDEYFPDEELNEKMREQLNAQSIEHYTFSSKVPDEEIKATIEDFGFKVMRISEHGDWKRAYFSVPDHNNRDKMIEKLLKLKNKYPAERHEHMVAEVKVIKFE